MHAKIPRWILVVVSTLYRFVVGAFGISFPHPHPTNFCPVFWLTVVGVSIGLPVVLFGWIMRLIFGRGRAQRLGNKLLPTIERFGKIALIVLTAGYALAVFGYGCYWFFERWGWWGPFILIGIIVVVLGFIIGLVMSIVWLGMKQEKAMLKPPKEPNPVIKGFSHVFKGFIWPFKILFKIIWGVSYFLVLMFYAFYKKFCPYTELP